MLWLSGSQNLQVALFVVSPNPAVAERRRQEAHQVVLAGPIAFYISSTWGIPIRSSISIECTFVGCRVGASCIPSVVLAEW